MSYKPKHWSIVQKLASQILAVNHYIIAHTHTRTQQQTSESDLATMAFDELSN
jgi:hypothetical protein